MNYLTNIALACAIVLPITLKSQPLHTVEMLNRSGQPIVSVEVNGKEAFFLVDTGSDITCIEKGYAKRFGFKYRKSPSRQIITGINSMGSTHFTVYGAELRMCNVRLYTKIKALDIKQIIESIYWDTGVRITGIIGSDIMKQYNFVIDYRKQKVSFSGFSMQENKM